MRWFVGTVKKKGQKSNTPKRLRYANMGDNLARKKSGGSFRFLAIRSLGE